MRPRRLALIVVAIPAMLAGCTSSRGGATLPSASSPSALSPSASSPASVPAGTSSAPSPSASSGDQPADWPMYHGNPQRSGVSAGMPAVSGALKLATALKLDGQMYASPIIVGGTVVAATENDTVYALDLAGRTKWKRTLGRPSPAEERQCGDITPLGITGTPVYDQGTGLVYVVAELAGNVRHELVGLDLKSGAVTFTKDVDLPGVSARDMQQRGALAIAHGRVWVSYGAQSGDCGDYKGRVVGVELDGSGDAIYYSPPTKRGGGIWNPAGPTVNRAGNLLVVSANGAAFPGDAYDHTNSVLEVDASAKVVDSFAPSDWAENNQGDVGLGSQGVALVGTKWAVLGGKSGPVYVLRQNDLGGIAGQVSVQDICKSFGGASVDGTVVYLPCTDGVRAVRVDDSGKLTVLWHADATVAGSPVVGGGRVWALDQQGGVLHALDPKTGATREQVHVGETSRFATPALYGKDVLVPTLAGLAVVTTS